MKKIFFFLVFFPFWGSSQTLEQLQELDILIFEAKYDDASKVCELLINQFPSNPKLYFNAGIIQQALNFDKKATLFFQKAFNLDSLSIDYQNFYANNLSLIGKNKEAILFFEKILQKYPFNFFALDKLSQLYIKQKLYNKANTVLEVLTRLYPENPYYLRQMGYCFTKQKGGGGFAMDYYLKAYEIDSSDVISVKQLANFYLRADKYDECIRIAERGVLLDSTVSEFYRLQAMAHFAKNHNFISLPNFLKTIQYGDSSLEVVKSTGVAYYLIKKYNEADRYLSAAYAEDSTDYMISLYLARNNYGLEKFEQSIEFYNKTLQLLMPNKQLMYNFYGDMAEALTANNEHEKALFSYKKREELFGFLSDYDYYCIALIYDKMQNSQKAIEYFELFVQKIKKAWADPYENKYFTYAETRLNKLKEFEHMKN